MSKFDSSWGGSSGAETTEIYIKRIMPGNLESVRARLALAMERVGYDVIEEEPALRGRRGEKGWGSWYGSADVMDYATTLVIRFKTMGPHSTRATFDYSIAHQWLQKGEKEVLVREAEAIVALASVRSADKLCMACGTETVDDSRFCRRCGAPLTSEQATLDLLRMTAESRAAHSSVVTSFILTGASILMLVAFVVGSNIGGKKPWIWVVLAGLVGLVNLMINRFAWVRLQNALRLKSEDTARPVLMRDLPSAELPALPPPAAGFSVTEGTTELFSAPKREPVSVIRDKRDTDSIN